MLICDVVATFHRHGCQATNISPLLGAAGADREGRRPTLVGAPCDGNYSQVVAAAIEELARIQVVGTQAVCPPPP